MKILIVDDDKYMRDLVTSILRKNTAEVVSHSNLGDALRHLMGEEFDYAIFDIHLPGMDGLSAIPIARELRPGMLIGVMTGDQDPATREKAFKKGADFFIYKPEDIMKVWDIISEYEKKKEKDHVKNTSVSGF